MSELSEETIERWSAYHEGELDAAERAEFEEELARDPEMAREYERFERTMQALAALQGHGEAPEDFERLVERRIRRRSRGRFFTDALWVRYRVPLAVYAVLALIVLLGFGLLVSPVGFGLFGSPPTESVDEPEAVDEQPPWMRDARGDVPQEEGSGAVHRPTVDPARIRRAVPVEQNHLDVVQQIWFYTIETQLAPDELERRVRELAGSRARTLEDGRVTVTVDGAEHDAFLERLAPLGDVERERRTLPQRAVDRTIELRPAD